MSEVKRISVFIHGPNKAIDMVEAVHLDRVTAERDASLAEVDRLDNALNVTDAAATKWLSDLTSARQLFELILDDPRLVVAMSSDILVPVKSLLAVKPEPFESKVSALQQRLTAADASSQTLHEVITRIRSERDALQVLLNAADERADVLEESVREALEGLSSAKMFGLRKRIRAVLKPAEGRGDE